MQMFKQIEFRLGFLAWLATQLHRPATACMKERTKSSPPAPPNAAEYFGIPKYFYWTFYMKYGYCFHYSMNHENRIKPKNGNLHNVYLFFSSLFCPAYPIENTQRRNRVLGKTHSPHYVLCFPSFTRAFH